MTSENPHFGTVPNPAAPGRVAGGSSGGNAAALAARLGDVALGTDSGGSIRIPAACCGIVGFKPTFGLVSLEGCFPLAPSFDHAGPMASDVADLRGAMRALAPGFEPQTLGRARETSRSASRGRRRRPARPGAGRGGRGALPGIARPVELPLPEGVGTALHARDRRASMRELFAENADLYGENVRTKIERCLAVTDAEAQARRASANEYRERLEAATGRARPVLTPTLPCVAPPLGGTIGELDVRERIVSRTLPAQRARLARARDPVRRGRGGLRPPFSSPAGPAATSSSSPPGELLEAALRQRVA